MFINSIDHLHALNLNIGKKTKWKAQVNLVEKQLYYFKSRDHSIKTIIVLTKVMGMAFITYIRIIIANHVFLIKF